jgi:hypothetical protein
LTTAASIDNSDVSAAAVAGAIHATGGSALLIFEQFEMAKLDDAATAAKDGSRAVDAPSRAAVPADASETTSSGNALAADGDAEVEEDKASFATVTVNDADTNRANSVVVDSVFATVTAAATAAAADVSESSPSVLADSASSSAVADEHAASAATIESCDTELVADIAAVSGIVDQDDACVAAAALNDDAADDLAAQS